jgi:hypothetical protein
MAGGVEVLLMATFLAHVGHPGNIDIEYTVTRRRGIREILKQLPDAAPERSYFASAELAEQFPDGTFNCWGVPSGAADVFNGMQVGDLVLIAPNIGVHGGIRQLGIVEAMCPVRCYAASRVLWPATPENKLFPLVFFFNTEVGFRGRFRFLEDIEYKERYNPRGLFLPIRPERFRRWGGEAKYLDFLRREAGFRPV